MGIGSRMGVLAAVAAMELAGCTMGPNHAVNGEYQVIVVGVSNTLVVLGQHGSAIAGYVAEMPPASDPASGQLVCGHGSGDQIQIYLPPDSSSVFSGTYKDAMTFTGTLTTSAGMQSAVLYGPVFDPPFIDGVAGSWPAPPTGC